MRWDVRPLHGMEEVLESTNVGGGQVTLIGTDRDERLVAIGDHVVVAGRGGDDDVLVDEGWTTRVRGGDGDDRIYSRATTWSCAATQAPTGSASTAPSTTTCSAASQ